MPVGSRSRAVSLSRQVQGTGGSSAVSKCSAAARGYIQDRFLRLLAGRRRRRAPLIHRGYYIRARAVDHCVQDFLLKTQSLPRTQILSLGAGFDSLYFRLKDMGVLHHTVVYEVDFPDVACQKATLIKGVKELSALVGDTGGEGIGAIAFSGDDYKLLGVDLSELSELERTLEEAGLNNEIPTLFIAEVVLTYMENTRSDALIQWAAEHFPRACFLLYEQVQPQDPFGRVMQQHFRQLSTALHSLVLYPDCQAQHGRFLAKGWTECSVMDMNEFFTCCIPEDEQQRVQTLEPFDEYEDLLCHINGKVVTETGGRFAKWFRNVCWNCRSRSLLLQWEGMASEMFSLLCVGCIEGDGTFLDSIVTQCDRYSSGSYLAAAVYDPAALNQTHPPFGGTAVIHILLQQFRTLHLLGQSYVHPMEAVSELQELSEQSRSYIPCHAGPVGVVGSVPAAVCAGLSGVPGLRRYGHRSVLVKPNVIVTTGGFGEEDGQHCRVRNFHMLSRRAGHWEAVCVTQNVPDQRWGERLYHTVSRLSDTLALVVGGRTSPPSTGLGMLWLKFPETWGASGPGDIAVELVNLQPAAAAAAALRWRHSTTKITFKGEQYLFVYGGRSALEPVLGDWHFLHAPELSCTVISVEGPVPESRHSHSACSWEGGVLIAGGLGAAEQPLGSVFLLRELERGFQWQTIETHPPLIPRYSHTAHVHEGKLLLVGGVWFHAPSVPGITVIDLMTGLCLNYGINVEHVEWPLMLHNHSSVFLPDEKELLVIGGGGNCFSFGTHLNPEPVLLSLSSILTSH